MVTPAVEAAEAKSVVSTPAYEQAPYANLVLSLATVADDIEPWGRSQRRRDMQLRDFWPTEPVLASSVFSVVARNAGFSWTLDGPPRSVGRAQELLHTADHGNGWLSFQAKISTDLYTQDNGCFIEIIRSGPNATDPVVGLGHLDAGRCRRTGVRDWPVVYTDRNGVDHRLAPHQCIAWAEWPSPIETMNGVGMCAVSRVLRAAQLLRDVSVYQREKVGGRNPAAIWLTNGVKSEVISDAYAAHVERQEQKGYARFFLPLIVAGLDPSATISAQKIDLASLPDGFDPEVVMRWYINQLALGFGADYQDFAPLPGGNLGTSAQSLVLHMKSRGKGPALFMKSVEYLLNFHGVLPANVHFRYDEQDAAADLEQAQLGKTRAEARTLDLQTGVLTVAVARRKMHEDGDLTEEQYQELVATAATEPGAAPMPDQNIMAEDAVQVGAQSRRRTPLAIGRKFIPAPQGGRERLTLEDEFAASLESALADAFRRLRGRLAAETKDRHFLGLRIGRKQEPAPDILAAFDDPGWWDEFRVLLIDAVFPSYRAITAASAARQTDVGIRVDLDAVNRRVLALAGRYTDDWWAELEIATRAGLRNALSRWEAGQLGTEGMPSLVDALEPLFGPARAQRIAVTETTRMWDLAAHESYAEAGVTDEEWGTVMDSHVCEECMPLDGQRWPIDEGPRPPYHIGCRCSRLPVVEAI